MYFIQKIGTTHRPAQQQRRRATAVGLAAAVALLNLMTIGPAEHPKATTMVAGLAQKVMAEEAGEVVEETQGADSKMVAEAAAEEDDLEVGINLFL